MLRRASLAVSLCVLLVTPARATWSIVVVDRSTGEVAVAAATCIATINLTRGLPAIEVGRGGGVVQASGAFEDLVPMARGLRDGLSPAEILELVIAAEPSPNQLQTAIVSLYPGAPVTFTGRNVGRAKLGVVGEVGELAYAIQGNVLAGEEVVLAAEAALLGTSGDLGQRLLASMQAARALGGDGRCSCDMGRPDSCGTPPESFEKSAHVGFLIVSRTGDPQSPCIEGFDCAEVPSYLRLNVRGLDAQGSDPDPVDQLALLYADWRAARLGRPDGILSRALAVDSLPADGATERLVQIELADIDGHPLTGGGALVSVAPAEGEPPLFELGPVADHGDGSYSFSLRAGDDAGTQRLVIEVADDLVRATLFPYLEVRADAPGVLHAGFDRVSAAGPVEVPFVVNAPERPGARYWLLARLAGGKSRGPGFDPALFRSVVPAGAPFFPGPPGELDRDGRAEASFSVPAGLLVPLIGMRLEWSARILGHGPPVASNTVAFAIVP